MGCASNDADQREPTDADRTEGARLLGCRNGEISVWERLGKAEGLRAEVAEVGFPITPDKCCTETLSSVTTLPLRERET